MGHRVCNAIGTVRGTVSGVAILDGEIPNLSKSRDHLFL